MAPPFARIDGHDLAAYPPGCWVRRVSLSRLHVSSSSVPPFRFSPRAHLNLKLPNPNFPISPRHTRRKIYRSCATYRPRTRVDGRWGPDVCLPIGDPGSRLPIIAREQLLLRAHSHVAPREPIDSSRLDTCQATEARARVYLSGPFLGRNSSSFLFDTFRFPVLNGVDGRGWRWGRGGAHPRPRHRR